MSKIATMLKLQQELNDATNGIGWENGVTNQGKPIDWRRCIYLECAELVESYPWKHWKNIEAKADSENIKIEVVDIWHFVMSEILKMENKNENLENLSQMIKTLPNFEKMRDNATDISQDYFAQIATIESFIKTVFTSNDWKQLVSEYFDIVAQSGLNIDSLYALYIGKNILNQFRQDNGYKEGTYQKIWGDVEDNVVMQTILHHNSNITPNELYNELSKRYNV